MVKNIKRWVVFVDDGYTRLMSPSGEIFTDEVDGVLKNTVEKKESTYTAIFVVDVVENKEKALAHLGLCNDK